MEACDTSGFASVVFPVPDDTRLKGGLAYAQAFVLDLLGAFGGFAMTGAARLVLGD